MVHVVLYEILNRWIL